MQKYQAFIFSIVFVACSLVSYAGGVLTLSDEDEYFLNEHIEILEDPGKALTIEDVSASAYAGQFVPSTGIAINRNLNSAYWVRFTLKDDSPADTRWLMECYDFKIDNIEFFVPDGKGGFGAYHTGDNYPFRSKIFSHKNFQFLLPDLKEGEGRTFYLRLEAKQYVAFIFVLRTYQRFTNYALMEYYFLGVFYGIVVIIGLVNLFLFLMVRSRAYLYYVLYVFSIGFFSASMDGTAFQFLWPDHPQWNDINPVAIASLLMMLFVLMYAKSFLILHENSRFFNVVLNLAILAKLGGFILGLVSDDPELLWNPKLDVFLLFTVYLAGIYCLKKGYKPARYYVLAFTFLFAGFIIFSLANQRYLPSNYLTIYALDIAAVIEMILLSAALADRVRTFKEDKEKAQQAIIVSLQENERLKDNINKELEKKVHERTKELEAANEEIRRMNDLLYADKTKLEHDVKDLSEARVMLKDVTFEEFKTIYPDENSCYEYLAGLKWEKGYKCRNCSNTNFSTGPLTFSRRCSKCSYIESVTADTLFFRLKFPILKAFYMVFLISTRKDITADELSEILSLRRQTCWSFKKKIVEAMESRKRLKNQTDGWSHIVLNSPASRKKTLA